MPTPVINTADRYGWVSIVLHWVVALAVFGLFALGTYMVDLTYYDSWYRSAPHIHKSIGLVLFTLVILRLLWRLVSPVPHSLPNHKRWEKVSAKLAHGVLYVLILVAMISGYLISTADNSGIDVFNWFTVPSLTGRQKGLEDTAGLVHYWATWGLLVLAVVHGVGALKHHLIDRDDTLRRMLGMSRRR
ncbi:cytochrome b [Marinobacter sp. 1Y8]